MLPGFCLQQVQEEEKEDESVTESRINYFTLVKAFRCLFIIFNEVPRVHSDILLLEQT